MKLEFGSKSQEYDVSGTASATKVILVNAEGANLPIYLPADKIDLSNAELFDLALDQLYQDNFPNKAENERFSAYDEMMEKMQASIDKAEDATETVISTLNGILLQFFTETDVEELEEEGTEL